MTVKQENSQSLQLLKDPQKDGAMLNKFPSTFKHKQIRHNPSEGVFGNCHQCCLSYLLQLPLDDVPYLGKYCGEDNAAWAKYLKEWASSKGLYPLTLRVDDKAILESYQLPYILSGPSPRYDCYHCVVAFGSEIIYDPYTGNGIIDEPLLSTDYWYMELFIRGFTQPNAKTT